MLPPLSPLIAANVICPRCASILKPKARMGRQGVEAVEYKCVNKEKGCSYMFESTTRVSCEMKLLRPDGSVAKI